MLVPRTSRHVRIALGLLSFAVLVLTVMVVLLVLWVVDLKNTRDSEAVRRQAAIDSTFCQVLSDLPANAPSLVKVRADLHCTSGGTP